jgi:hypothetical protein
MTIHPMMGVDGSRMPRGVKPKVSPGRTIVTNGNPKDILMPFNFGRINTETFAQGGELERMLQMATGAMDTQTSVASNPRNNTASGMSMMASSSIKRTKRTMQNVDRDFLQPLIRKCAWRYMQFDNEKYPIDDYLFVPRSTMGMMAREFEQQQMTQLLQTSDPSSPVYGMILAQIIDNSSGENKEELKKAIQAMYQPPQPDPVMQKAKELEIAKMEAEIAEIKAKTAEKMASAQTKPFEAKTNRLRVEGEIQDKELDRQGKDDGAARTAIAKAKLDNEAKLKIAALEAQAQKEVEEMKNKAHYETEEKKAIIAAEAQVRVAKQTAAESEKEESPEEEKDTGPKSISITRENGQITGLEVK